MGQVKSLDSVSLSRPPVKLTTLQRAPLCRKQQIKEYIFTLYSALRAGSLLLSEEEEEEEDGSSGGLPAPLSSSHINNNKRTHTPFPIDGCVGFRLLLTDLYNLSM